MPELQARMAGIAAILMRGLDYGDGFFNVEFMVDRAAGTIHIIEVNPRLASQFADRYEKVDGTNSYEMLLDIALGRRVARRRGGGAHRVAASCVLRRFEDAYVRGVPDAHSIEKLERRYPDLRVEVLADPGDRLSRTMQDGRSFRYAVLNIGARDRAGIRRILRECMAGLRFDFKGAPAAPARPGAPGPAFTSPVGTRSR